MAHVVFVSLHDRNAHGLRMMSANLKKQGHRCSIIFLKRYEASEMTQWCKDPLEFAWIKVDKNGRLFKFGELSPITPVEYDLLRTTLERLKPDVIGMTVNTPLRRKAEQVTRFLKNHFTVPVIWGGYDATVNVAQCVDYCDYTCVGEGDATIMDVASRIEQGRPLDDVRNLSYRRDGNLVQNEKHPLEMNLDNYPWRDDEPEDKYFIEDNALEENHATVNDKPFGNYQTTTSRGCPYRCSFCCEATFKELYDGEKFLRRRSPQDVIAELMSKKDRLGINLVHFEDEIFAIDVKWLREFFPLYKEKIAQPFAAYIYPGPRIEEILNILREGLHVCCLGLESGSKRINKEVFQRVYDRQLHVKTAHLLKKLKIAFYTDVITFNPYEEQQDLEDTLDVLLEMDGGFGIAVNKLFVLPGIGLADKMQKDGVNIDAPAKQRMFHYYSRLFHIAAMSPHSRTIIKVIKALKIFKWKPELLNPVHVEYLIAFGGKVRSVAHRLMPRSLVNALSRVPGAVSKTTN